MVTTSSLMDLLQHMQWADAAVWRAVLAADAARADENLRARLHHLHMVQYAFLRLWRGEPRDNPYPTLADTPSLLPWAMAYHGMAQAHLEMLDDDALAQPQTIPWAARLATQLGRHPEPSTVADMAFHVVMHSAYHRGQVNLRLREVGGEPPLVDYIAWVWLGRPAPQWPV